VCPLGMASKKKKILRHEHLIYIKPQLKGGDRDVIIRTTRKESTKLIK
jgi:hypothetical protein